MHVISSLSNAISILPCTVIRTKVFKIQNPMYNNFQSKRNSVIKYTRNKNGILQLIMENGSTLKKKKNSTPKISDYYCVASGDKVLLYMNNLGLSNLYTILAIHTFTRTVIGVHLIC